MVQVDQSELVAGAIAGKIVSFPTDTVPALAVKPELANLVYQLKQRPRQKPLILLGASVDDFLPYLVFSHSNLSAWKKLMSQHWPGALTLVLPASHKVPLAINSTNSNTVGIRIPNCDLALAILSQTGVLATTSANISGQDALLSMDAIEEVFPTVLTLKQNMNYEELAGSGLPSTVICWNNYDWQLLRQGSVYI